MTLQSILNGAKRVATAVGKTADYAGRHPKISLPVCGALATYLASIAIPGKTVFDGRIGDSQVTYMEGFATWNPFARENIMIAKKNGARYTFVDSKNRTGIDWHSENPAVFGNDKLEYVVIDGRDKDYDFDSEQVGTNSIEGVEAKEVFVKADSWYNRMRGSIRDELRAKYTGGLVDLKKNLD